MSLLGCAVPPARTVWIPTTSSLFDYCMVAYVVIVTVWGGVTISIYLRIMVMSMCVKCYALSLCCVHTCLVKCTHVCTTPTNQMLGRCHEKPALPLSPLEGSVLCNKPVLLCGWGSNKSVVMGLWMELFINLSAGHPGTKCQGRTLDLHTIEAYLLPTV